MVSPCSDLSPPAIVCASLIESMKFSFMPNNTNLVGCGMGMGFALTWLLQLSPPPLHITAIITGVWVSPSNWEESGEGSVSRPQIIFSPFLELKIASFAEFWVLFFVSLSKTDGLLWEDLSGLIVQGNRENPQYPDGHSCLHCVLAAAQCIVISPVCVCQSVCVGLLPR